MRTPALIAAFVALVACAPGGATIVVQSRSDATITEVLISVRGAKYRIAELRPGEVRAFAARPRGESGMAVSYRAGGRLVEVPEEGYFENNSHYVVILDLGDAKANIVSAFKTESPG